MDRFALPSRSPWQRAALPGAAFVASSVLLGAVLAAFDSVSREAWLSDSPRARLAVARCDALGDRAARRHCVYHLVAQARARDTRVALLAEASPPPGSAPR